MKTKNFLSFIIIFSICLTAGIVASYPVSVNMVWYETLNISGLNPPSWVFGPVWSVIYLLMAISFWIVVKNGYGALYVLSIFMFSLQLILNVAWSYIFFGAMNPPYAFMEILILDAAVLITISVYGKISKAAKWIMLPYVIWLGFATYLNWYVMAFNQPLL